MTLWPSVRIGASAKGVGTVAAGAPPAGRARGRDACRTAGSSRRATRVLRRVLWGVLLTVLLHACGKGDDPRHAAKADEGGAAAPVVAQTTGAARSGRHGAYAYSPEARYGAFVLDGASTAAAEQGALDACQTEASRKGGRCQVLTRFSDGCAALAAGRNGVHVTATAPTAAAACTAALDLCSKRDGTRCGAVTVGCMDNQSVDFCKNALAARPPQPPSPSRLTASGGPFGAIAVSPDGQHAGFSIGKANRDAAEADAVSTCEDSAKGQRCEAMLWYRNACGALATGDEGAFGTGWGNSRQSACGWALRTCRDYGGRGCEANWYECSPSGQSGSCDGKLKTYK